MLVVASADCNNILRNLLPCREERMNMTRIASNTTIKVIALMAALFYVFCAVSTVRADDIPASRTGAPLTLLQINDVYSTVPVDGGKVGGLARVASLVKQLKAEGR